MIPDSSRCKSEILPTHIRECLQIVDVKPDAARSEALRAAS
jgi:hypothetical protein